MYPKKAKDVVANYTERTNVPLDDSELMINHYYRTIRQKTSAMNEHWNLRILGLGNLKASYSKVMKGFYNQRSNKLIAKNEGDEYQYIQSVEKVNQLVEMIRIFREEKKREDEVNKKKKQYKEKRNREQYAAKRDPKTGMGKQDTDS